MVAISVVMPTYNTDVQYLKEAVDSILNQTFRDFEFLIIDDGSTNDSPSYLSSLSDPRVKVIRNESNMGITKTLNKGLRLASGKYIARMDSDDVSLPERFEKQFAFMESHPDVFACGANAVNLGDPIPATTKKMEDMDSYRVRMLFSHPGPHHPTAFFNHAKLLEHNIMYDEELIYAQDYGIWATISQLGQICILPEVLVLRRVSEGQISRAQRPKQIKCDQMTQKKLLEQLLGKVTQEEVEMHYHYSTPYYKDAKINSQVNAWYQRILRANKEKRIYNQEILKARINRIKIRLISQSNANKIKHALMLFRYLPFSVAFKEIIHSVMKKGKHE